MIGYKLAVHPVVGPIRREFSVIRLADDRTLMWTESQYCASNVVIELNKLYAESQGKEAWIDYVVSGTPL